MAWIKSSGKKNVHEQLVYGQALLSDKLIDYVCIANRIHILYTYIRLPKETSGMDQIYGYANPRSQTMS